MSYLDLEARFPYTCPKCGGNLLLISAAGDIWNVDPATGELTWRQQVGQIRIFECKCCGELYKNIDDFRLPFRLKEREWEVVAY
ncbi:hypothetical protein EDD75_2236 [Thermodesulfitimonas autotrophica]|uniref:Uncharacterized protein n=1 Tax=Thermodesulfitimonas autotrophica TaxID=1894989 RepID=A0A3N5B8J2_9THEO|nr:hypothetical protein [Thermodesulfitimonas autotrophica]RPF42015.1 hypothetical protein EDD75_2236 [Thermodesulfitimonas autotrophica]